MRIPSTTLIVIVAAVSVSCARTPRLSSTSRQLGALAGAPTHQGSLPEMLTGAELREAKVASTAEGVRRLRPEFLRPVLVPMVGAGPLRAYASVYLNGVYAGSLDALETVPLDVVEEIRFVREPQAKSWWGSYCPCAGGVIAVRTKKVY